MSARAKNYDASYTRRDWTEYLSRFAETRYETKPVEETHRLEIDLPMPPSTNHYWRFVPGRQKPLISAEGRSYRATVRDLIRRHGVRMRPGRYGVRLTAHAPDRRRRDLDNLLKASLDALQHAGVYEDDGDIDVIHVARGATQQPGRLRVCVKLIGMVCP